MINSIRNLYFTFRYSQKNLCLCIIALMENREKIDQYYMSLALKEAQYAFEKDEVPVGAILLQDDRIVARGHNQVELLQDATAHAEVLCLTSAFASLNSWRIPNLTLYCTLEPCIMCAGAIYSSRVKRLVYGAKDIRLGANGSLVDLFSIKHPMHSVEITEGVLADESAFLLKTFFKGKRGPCCDKS